MPADKNNGSLIGRNRLKLLFRYGHPIYIDRGIGLLAGVVAEALYSFGVELFKVLHEVLSIAQGRLAESNRRFQLGDRNSIRRWRLADFYVLEQHCCRRGSKYRTMLIIRDERGMTGEIPPFEDAL